MIKITKINKILELLTEKELTSLEISAELGIAKDILFPKITRLRKEHRIMRINKKKPYKYKTITPKALLKQLYNFMSDENKCTIKNFQEKDLELVQTIKEMIK